MYKSNNFLKKELTTYYTYYSAVFAEKNAWNLLINLKTYYSLQASWLKFSDYYSAILRNEKWDCNSMTAKKISTFRSISPRNFMDVFNPFYLRTECFLDGNMLELKWL